MSILNALRSMSRVETSGSNSLIRRNSPEFDWISPACSNVAKMPVGDSIDVRQLHRVHDLGNLAAHSKDSTSHVGVASDTLAGTEEGRVRLPQMGSMSFKSVPRPRKSDYDATAKTLGTRMRQSL
jgi:hypothetical protein